MTTRFNPDDSELITDEQAEALVSRIISGESVAQALREVIEWLADCQEDMRETNADTLEGALEAVAA